MDEIMIDQFNELVKALREKTALLIVDSKSKYEKCVFSLGYFDVERKTFNTFSYLLKKIGFRQSKSDVNLFTTYCAGRFNLWVFENIGQELRGAGFTLPNDWNEIIYNQNSI